jgi:cyclophilin family peptidyl-prolyl cis-trans isomerase
VTAIRAKLFLLLVVTSFAPALVSCGGRADTADELAVIETNYGPIVIEFYPNSAPMNIASFKQLAREGFYNGSRFHRISREQDQTTPIALHGGDPNSINGDPSTWGNGQPGQPTVPAEFSKEYKHDRGTVSAFHPTDKPDGATSQFFICVKRAPQLDGNYSVLGHVIEGMNVVDALINRRGSLPKGLEESDPRYVKRIYLVKRGEYKSAAAAQP